MRVSPFLYGFVGWLLLSGSAARADLVFYQDRASFEAATTARTVVDFQGLAPSPTSFTYFQTPPGITLQGVNFNIANPLPMGMDGLNPTGRDYYAPFFPFPSDFLVPSASTRVGTDLTITLPGGFTAIGLDFGSFYGTPFTFHLSTGEMFTEPTPSPLGSLSFLGFTSTEPITSLTVSSTGSDVPVLTDVIFGTTVPEPGTLMLVAVGGLCLLAWGRRRPTWCRPGTAPHGRCGR
jgi:hypothetical protein